jgi:hypothetical protein
MFSLNLPHILTQDENQCVAYPALLCLPVIALFININLFCVTLSLATKNGASTLISSKGRNG